MKRRSASHSRGRDRIGGGSVRTGAGAGCGRREGPGAAGRSTEGDGRRRRACWRWPAWPGQAVGGLDDAPGHLRRTEGRSILLKLGSTLAAKGEPEGFDTMPAGAQVNKPISPGDAGARQEPAGCPVPGLNPDPQGTNLLLLGSGPRPAGGVHLRQADARENDGACRCLRGRCSRAACASPSRATPKHARRPPARRPEEEENTAWRRRSRPADAAAST